MREKTYFVDLPDYGTFEFKRFTIFLRHKVSINYQKMVEGNDEYLTETEKTSVWVLAYLKTIWVNAPVDLEDLDIEEADELLNKLFEEVQQKESFFRGGASKDSKDQSTGTSAES